MLQDILHVGLTVSDMDRSIAFYRDVLGLAFQGELLMEGHETDRLFRMKGCKARVAYLKGTGETASPPVELIQFLNAPAAEKESNLHSTSISELCFQVNDIETVYQVLMDRGVECLSPPQSFDFTASGFGKSKALYFKDPDGIILELMESAEN